MKKLETYISVATREFKRLKSLSDNAVAQIPKSKFFHRASEGDNSIALIYKHMIGKILSRWSEFLTTDGEKPSRKRDEEFAITNMDTQSRLLRKWNEA